MRWLFVLGVVGCYSPTVHPGAPCGAGSACPGDLVCDLTNTCVEPGSTQPDAPLGDGPIVDAGLDGCTTCNAPANDLPGSPIDITAGGDFTADLTYAHNDGESKNNGGVVCGAAGGLDVFYKVHTTGSEVYYFDTFGSDFDTVIRVFKGACVGGIAPNSTVCHNNSLCGGVQTQWAGSLASGDNCIVIDGVDGAQTGHSLKLHVERGHRDGIAVNAIHSPMGAYTFTGDTTTASNVEDGTCAQHQAHDVGYYFLGCPGQTLTVSASTCNATQAMTPWDTTVYSRGPNGQIACMDDDMGNCVQGGQFSTINFTASEAHLYWVILDGAGGSPNQGPYELDLNFQ